MSIRVDNVKTWIPKEDECAFYVGRPNANIPKNVIQLTDLGNPWNISSKASRTAVITMYHVMMNNAMVHKPEINKALRIILEAHKTNNIVLLCWCAPEPCHADIIRDTILKMEGMDTQFIRTIEMENKLDIDVANGAMSEEIDDRIDLISPEDEEEPYDTEIL